MQSKSSSSLGKLVTFRPSRLVFELKQGLMLILIWIVLQYLFDSVMDISVLQCGHTMHRACLRQMTLHSQYALNLSNRILFSIRFPNLEFVLTGRENTKRSEV